MAHTTEELSATDVDALLTRIAEGLSDRFAGVFAAETIERYLFESYATLRRTARICHHLPAGSPPAAELEPAVVQVMAELGLDLAAGQTPAYPKPLTDDVVRAADAVVTMGCGDACPIYPGKRYLDWDLPDSAGKDLATVRQIRHDIDTRVQNLLAQITPSQRISP